VHHQGEQEVNFLMKFLLGVVNLAVLACVLRTTTEKVKKSTFWGRKCTPEKILATPMGLT